MTTQLKISRYFNNISVVHFSRDIRRGHICFVNLYSLQCGVMTQFRIKVFIYSQSLATSDDLGEPETTVKAATGKPHGLMTQPRLLSGHVDFVSAQGEPYAGQHPMLICTNKPCLHLGVPESTSQSDVYEPCPHRRPVHVEDYLTLTLRDCGLAGSCDFCSCPKNKMTYCLNTSNLIIILN